MCHLISCTLRWSTLKGGKQKTSVHSTPGSWTEWLSGSTGLGTKREKRRINSWPVSQRLPGRCHRFRARAHDCTCTRTAAAVFARSIDHTARVWRGLAEVGGTSHPVLHTAGPPIHSQHSLLSLFSIYKTVFLFFFAVSMCDTLVALSLLHFSLVLTVTVKSVFSACNVDICNSKSNTRHFF